MMLTILVVMYIRFDPNSHTDHQRVGSHQCVSPPDDLRILILNEQYVAAKVIYRNNSQSPGFEADES